MPKIQADRFRDRTTSIRERIAVSKAIDIVNAVLSGNKTANGKPIKRNQEWMAWKVIDKMLPSLQAVNISAEVTHVQTLQDVNAQLLLAGIQPEQAWQLLRQQPRLISHDNNEENQQLATESDATHPPERE